MCLCHKVTVEQDLGYLKPKAFLMNTLDHRIGTVARERSPPSKKNPLAPVSLHDECRARARVKVEQTAHYPWIKMNQHISVILWWHIYNSCTELLFGMPPSADRDGCQEKSLMAFISTATIGWALRMLHHRAFCVRIPK